MRKRNRNSKQNSSALVDIAIVTGGRFDLLKKCLESIESTTEIPVNVIVFDNATDAEERIANNDLFKDITEKRLTQEVGFPQACNEAARMGKAPLILFLGDDVELTQGCIDAMVKTLDDPQIAAVGPKLLFPENSSHPNRPAGKVQHVGLALNIHGGIIHPLVGWSKENPKTCISRDVFAITGACFMVRRSLFDKAGGFNLMYGMGTYEDADLCLTLRRLGYRIFVNTDAVAYHYVGATAEKKKRAFPLQINAMTFTSRWANSGLMVWDEWTFW